MSPFAVWLTGIPGSGKSAIARELGKLFHERKIDYCVLESDVLRTQLTPHPRYDEPERDFFYATLAELGASLVRRGVPVVFDATANKRAYREAARKAIGHFVEVYVDTPLEVCAARDPKFLYRAAREGKAPTVPGVQAAYEPPFAPELVVHGDRGSPEKSAARIVEQLARRGWLEG
jgi:adenylylsulfate kinase